MDAFPLLNLALVSSALSRALCLSTASRRGCDEGAETPRLVRSRSWTSRRAIFGDSYMIRASWVSQYLFTRRWMAWTNLSLKLQDLRFLNDLGQDWTPFRCLAHQSENLLWIGLEVFGVEDSRFQGACLIRIRQQQGRCIIVQWHCFTGNTENFRRNALASSSTNKRFKNWMCGCGSFSANLPKARSSFAGQLPTLSWQVRLGSFQQ